MAERIEKTTGLDKGEERLQQRLIDGSDRNRGIFDGAVLINAEIDCSDNNTKRVQHRLGKKPQGVILVHWSSDNLGEVWTLRATDLAKESVELQVYNVSATGVYQLRILVF